MVDEYHTGNPVPSSAMPDAWDNNATIDAFVSSKDLKVKTRTGIERDTMSGMQKKFDDQLIQQRVDFDVQHLSQSDTFNISQNEREETFSRQLSEQESIFESSQADKENRFASFLDSSGYVFLGEYQNGPFQFSSRNQYIRYNNQYYRLNAATDVGFTTTGTDATSFANDVTHFVLMDGDTLRQNLGSDEGFKLVGQFQSVAMLSAHPGSDGERVLVIGYQVGSNLGGGEFYYDSSQSAVNNGVTVFNGWCRKNITELSTWDAGLVPGDDSNASPAIQRLFDAAPEGCTIYIDGRHCITRPHYLRGKPNLKILPRNGGFLDGITLREQFEFILVDGWEYYAPYAGATQGYPGGIISALDCPGIEIGERLKIRGPKKRFNKTAADVTLRREYGDSGIQLRNCPGAKINKIDAYHFWSWGIYSSVGGHDSEANGNYVGDCAVQSGINIWNGCNNCQANDNTVNDARLYGLEVEVLDSVMAVYGKIIGARGRGNKISGSKWAVAAVRGVFTAEITKTEIEDCFYGFNAVKNKDVPRKIDFIHNNVSRTLVHLHTSGSQNVHMDHNDLIETVKPDYAVLNQYSVIVDLETDPTKFRIFYSGNENLTTTVQIRGVVYTIANRTVVADANYTYGESRYVIVTLTTELASDVEVGDTLLQSTEFVDTTAHATSLMYTEDDAYLKGVTFGKNNLIGAFKVYERFETIFADNETIAISSFGHSLIKTANSAINPAYRFARASAWANAIELRGIDHSEGMSFYLPVKSGGTKNVKPYREIQRSKIVSIAAGGTFPVEYFYDNSDRMVTGVDITLTNVHSGSNIQLRIDGAAVYTSVFLANATTTAVASFKDRNMTVGLAANANTGTGRHSLQLFTSDNTAVCDGYTITLYLL
ncbi:right-handed parallel beta-helix repeat-containing protein [Klebsiella pneumoniae]|uniref:right-handed parallel beta-helix repeat-containing protein n=1 Tax=Klebsiella pneumoniae TaxID=573 RepID=UPI003B53003D